MTKIGIFGGSFDPVHLGHLWIAEAALESLGLKDIRWIPAATSPLKPNGPVAPDEQRLQMLQLAIGGAAQHIVDDREIRREGMSYTFDTVCELKSENPEAEIVVVIGSDSLETMPKWHRPSELLEQVTLAVVQRGGDPEIDFAVLNEFIGQDRIKLFQQNVIKMPVIELSSSEIRDRVRAGQSIRFRTPRAVEAMIFAAALYSNSVAES